MKFVLRAVFVTAIACCIMSPRAHADDTLCCDRIVNNEGWDIPGLHGAAVKLKPTSHTAFTHAPADLLRRLTFTVLVPRDRAKTYDLQLPFLDETSRSIVIHHDVFRVAEIRRYELDGRPYCYKLTEELVRKANGRTLTLAYSELLFSDENGNGRFTVISTRAPALPNIPLPSAEFQKR